MAFLFYIQFKVNDFLSKIEPSFNFAILHMKKSTLIGKNLLLGAHSFPQE